MLKTIKNIVRLVLKNFSFLLILFVLFTNNVLRAEDAEKKFIGFVDSVEGSVNKEDVDDLIKLNAFDQIFTHDKIKIGSDSSIVVSFIDNSILTLESDSEFLVEKFDKISEEPSFIIAITKGKFAFESGTIAKNDKGIMKIKLGEMEIDLKGTAITGGFSGGEITIALVEDTMKNTGEIKVSTGDETITITEAHAGLKLSKDTPMEKTTMSEEEIIKAADAMSKAVVQASTIDPKEIERAIMKQLAEGKSGLTNLADVEALLANISSFQDDKRESIVAESTGDLSILSEIIVNSDSEQSLSLMQGIMDNDTGSATLLMNEIMGGKDEKADFDIFSHIAGADAGNFEALRETIVAGMIEDQSTFATDTMAQMMKVSDDATGSYLVYEITHMEPTETTGYEGASLAMNVLASFTAIASEKMTEIYQQDPTMIDMLTTFAFESATEEDLGMMSTMMQNSTGGNTAMLMQSMVAYNPEMVATVYDDLTSQDFDIFNHIETGRKAATILANEYQADPTMLMDPTFEDPAYEEPYDPAYGDPTMQFFDDLKSEIFTEIVNNYEGTAAEITSELMMNTSGDNAMFMMEDVMYDNPELVGQVMSSFAEEEFDIFEHFETAPLINENQAMVIQSPYQEEFDPERVKLTKEERELAKAEKKAARILAKTEKKAEKKSARILAKTEKKAAKLLAKQTGFMAEEDPFMTEDPYMTNEIYGMPNFKAQIFTEMITYADENTMDTMAQIVSTSDAETSALIFASVIQQPSMTDTTTSMYAPETGGMALEFLDSLNQIDSEAIGTMYEENSSLMGDVFESALSSVTSTDAGAISGIISSSSNEAMSSMMFQNISNNADQDFMGEVFVYVATNAPEIIMAIAEENESLYEDMAKDTDIDIGIVTAASLITDISDTENDNYTTAVTDTTTGVSAKTKKPTMMKPYASNPYQIDTWMSGIYVYAESRPYTNGVTIDATGLPPGLYFSSSGDGGEISGTPTTKGNYQVFVTATDMIDPSKFRTRNFAIRVKQNAGSSGSGLSWMSPGPIAPTTLTKDTYISQIYLYTTGGTSPITYSDTNLPPGLYITSFGSSYVISGAPADTGPAMIATITAEDMSGSTSTVNINFPAVGAASGSSVTWTTTPAMLTPATLKVDTSITSISLTATGVGVISYTPMNLPPGLSISGSILSGAPTMVNNDTVEVTITATDDMNTPAYYMDDVTADLTATFPAVGAAGGSGPTWSAVTAPVTLTVSTALSPNITLSASGTGTVTYADENADLPSGLSLDGTTGVISGTPDATSMTMQTVVFTATDDYDSSTSTTSVNFPMVGAASGPTWSAVTAPVTLTVSTALSPNITLSASGTGTVTYADENADLPSGLSLDGTTGVISGTPDATSMTMQTVVFTATDDYDSSTSTTSVNFPMVGAASGPTWSAVTAPVTLTVSTALSPNITLSASGTGTVTYADENADLPSGLSLDGTTGVISGTPDATSMTMQTVVFTATDDYDSSTSTTSVNFPMVGAASGPTWSAVTAPVTLTVSTALSPNITLSASGTGTVTYADENADLPSGLSLDGTTGVISGTPDATSMTMQTVVFTATDDYDSSTSTTSVNFPMVGAASGPTWSAVTAPVTLTVSTALSPNITLSASGTGTVTYADENADLPSGLSLDGTTGVISGTPDATSMTMQTVVFTATDDYDSSTSTTSVNFPMVGAAAETFAFDTDADLGTKPGGVSFAAIPITATASQGTAFTYLFTSNDPTNFAITVTNNNDVSGIPPRLLNAATFEIVGKIKVGAVTKGTRTFTMLISAYSPCLSPVVNNICS